MTKIEPEEFNVDFSEIKIRTSKPLNREVKRCKEAIENEILSPNISSFRIDLSQE